MKKIRLFVLAAMLMVTGLATETVVAQSVRYAYHLHKEERCIVNFSVTQQDSTYYIVVCMTSQKLRFLDQPTMKLQTGNGEVVTLTGQPIGNSQDAFRVGTSYFSLPIKNTDAVAMFPASAEQFEQLKHGVTKIRISMVPFCHDRSFDKDLIGKPLYDLYKKLKDVDF